MEMYRAGGRAPGSEAGSASGAGHSGGGDAAKYCSRSRVTNGQGLCPTGDFYFFFKGRAFTNDSKLFLIFIPPKILVEFTVISTDTTLFARENKNKRMKSNSLAQ